MASGGAISEVINKAGDEKTSIEELIELAKHPYFAVRESVADNKNFGKLPIEVQEALIKENPDVAQNREVCMAAARNSGLSESMYELAAHNKSAMVRAAFASNETKSEKFLPFLMELLLDPNQDVRLAAVHNKRIEELDLADYRFVELIKQENNMAFLIGLSKHKLPEKLFEILSSKSISEVKKGNMELKNTLLANPSLPASLKGQILQAGKRKLRI